MSMCSVHLVFVAWRFAEWLAFRLPVTARFLEARR